MNGRGAWRLRRSGKAVDYGREKRVATSPHLASMN